MFELHRFYLGVISVGTQWLTTLTMHHTPHNNYTYAVSFIDNVINTAYFQ